MTLKPDVGRLACNEMSPEHEELNRRVRCNRIAGHAGPHRRIRASDFLTTAEWSGQVYTVHPSKGVMDDDEAAEAS